MEVDFDVIVVGGGIAGSVCALKLAQMGHEVALVDRGETPGAKNLSGGVFYSAVMDEVIPDFTQRAPVERLIGRNELLFLTKTGHVGLTTSDTRLVADANACSVLRAKLDRWLAEQAEEAGVAVVAGMLVDRILTEDGRVCGVAVGDDELRSHVVVAADGVNSFIARSLNMRSRQPNHSLAVGVKSVIELGEDTIRERFQLTEDSGAAYAMVGEATRGVAGGGFCYTNRSSVSIGVVLQLASLLETSKSSIEIHDAFLAHPSVAPLIDGGKRVEYGCHMTIESGASVDASLVGDGIVVVGDAAGLTLNVGYAIRGMDLAAASALAAAGAIHDALDAGDVTRTGLSSYVTRLSASPAGADIARFAPAATLFSERSLYEDLPDVLGEAAYRLYRHDKAPHEPARAIVADALRRSGVSIVDLARMGWKGVSHL